MGFEVYFYSPQRMAPYKSLKFVESKDITTAVIQSIKCGIDVLIFNNRNNRETIEGVIKAEESGRPCIVWDQNGPSPEMADLFHTLKAVRRVICVSATQADNSRDHPIFQKIEVVYNAINPKQFIDRTPKERNLLGVCYLGSLTPAKGFQHLAAAWPLVRRAFPMATLAVLGSGKLYDRNAELGPLGIADPEFEISHLIPHLGPSIEAAKSKGVNFMGLATPNIIRSVVSSSLIGVVNPKKRSETFCVSAVEIQGLGTAVVGGKGGGLNETVKNGTTGILVGSERDLAEALKKLLSNPDQAITMGRQGTEWVNNHFSLGVIMDRWSSLLEAVKLGIEPKPPDFSWQRATPQVVMRECIHHIRKVPVLRKRMPTLHEFKQKLSKLTKNF